MTQDEVVQMLRSGRISEWNDYRKRNSTWIPDLSGLDLSDVAFVSVTGPAFDLTRARLLGTKFPDDRLKLEIPNNNRIDLKDAQIDIDTKFPQRFDPVAHGAKLVSKSEASTTLGVGRTNIPLAQRMTIPTPPPGAPTETATISALSELLRQGKQLAARFELPTGLVGIWFNRVRVQLHKIYGPESEILALWPVPDGPLSIQDARPTLINRLMQLERYLSSLSAIGKTSYSGPTRNGGIFIGHGRSPIWRELKDFLHDRLALQWNEFNRDAVAGITTSDRLMEMLDTASFAFLIMTGEDEHADATSHARANVIHEVGLFQGRLGTRKAIILLEKGCQDFSNIHGLSHIPFPRGRVSASFEEIRRVLEREQIVTSAH